MPFGNFHPSNWTHHSFIRLKGGGYGIPSVKGSKQRLASISKTVRLLWCCARQKITQQRYVTIATDIPLAHNATETPDCFADGIRNTTGSLTPESRATINRLRSGRAEVSTAPN